MNTELDLKNEIEPNIKEDIHSWYQILNANSQPFQMTTSEVNSTMTVKVTSLTNLCAEVAQDLITVYMLYQEVCIYYSRTCLFIFGYPAEWDMGPFL